VLHDLGRGDAESHALRELVEPRTGEQLTEHLLIEADRRGLLGRDRPAELLAQLLHSIVVALAELIDGDLGIADLGQI
jgi:hypothetical protein